MEAHADLSLELTLTTDVDINLETTGSAWFLDVRVKGTLDIHSVVVSSVKIFGGGLLRAVGNHVELNNVTIHELEVTGAEKHEDYLATDTMIQLQPLLGPLNMSVGSPAWLDNANSKLMTSERAASSTAAISNVKVSMVKTTSISSFVALSGFAHVDVDNVEVRCLEMSTKAYPSEEFDAACNSSSSTFCAAKDCQLAVARFD